MVYHLFTDADDNGAHTVTAPSVPRTKRNTIYLVSKNRATKQISPSSRRRDNTHTGVEQELPYNSEHGCKDCTLHTDEDVVHTTTIAAVKLKIYSKGNNKWEEREKNKG